jgi:hypothetical protein
MKPCGLNETTKSASTVSLKKGGSLRGLIESAEAASAVSLKSRKPTISDEYLKFLGKFKAICETALALNQGPCVGRLLKKEGQKSRDTVPLNTILKNRYFLNQWCFQNY